MAGLTPMQAVFCREYQVDFHGTNAAIRAGYSPRSARVQASTLLALPHIQAELARVRQTVEAKTTLSMAEVLDELRKLALANIKDLVKFDENGDPMLDLQGATRDQLAAVSELTVVTSGKSKQLKAKFWDKKGALDTLLKHLGGLPETNIHLGPNGQALAAPPLNITVVTKK